MLARWVIKSPGLCGEIGSQQLLSCVLYEKENIGLDYEEEGN